MNKSASITLVTFPVRYSGIPASRRSGKEKIRVAQAKLETSLPAWAKHDWGWAEPAGKKKVLPVSGETFTVEGYSAFVILLTPENLRENSPIPWVWYAPTFPNLPEERERWMIERFHAAGTSTRASQRQDGRGPGAGGRAQGVQNGKTR